jgi:hypothetical protein
VTQSFCKWKWWLPGFVGVKLTSFPLSSLFIKDCRHVCRSTNLSPRIVVLHPLHTFLLEVPLTTKYSPSSFCVDGRGTAVRPPLRTEVADTFFPAAEVGLSCKLSEGSTDRYTRATKIQHAC